MAVLALSTPVMIALAALLVFGAAVMVRMMLDLVRHVGELRSSVARAGEHLRAAADQVASQTQEAADRAQRIRRHKP